MLIGASAAAGNDFSQIVRQITGKAKSFLKGNAPHLTFLFVTPDFADQLGYAIDHIIVETETQTVIGCTAEGVIGPEGEFERVSSASVWMGYLPHASIKTFYIDETAIESSQSQEDWQELFQTDTPAESSLLFLGDPYSLNVHTFLDGVNLHLPGLPVMGGMASGADESGLNSLFLNSDIYHQGAVCALITNKQTPRSLVSQGCRPIGKPYLVTSAERNVIHQIGSEPPLSVLGQLFSIGTEREQHLIQNGVFIGRVVNEYKKVFKRGDFLIRNVIGGDKKDGSVAVMDIIPVGTTVQFHVRDAQTAEVDLREMLDSVKKESYAGGLFFNCNGRGTRLFEENNHDLNLINQILNNPPVAGIFCVGEFGPVCGKNFIHGHTASLVFFPVE